MSHYDRLGHVRSYYMFVHVKSVYFRLGNFISGYFK
jgi:hypothetical protein